MSSLKPEKALIFRITHIENVAWILSHGLHCKDGKCSDPNYVEIGNPDLIGRRTQRVVPIVPGGTLSEYIPFYFTPYSPMLLNIKTGYNGIKKQQMSNIVICVTSLIDVAEAKIGFVFTDRHAYLQTANFFNDLGKLDKLDWKILQARDFKRDPDDPGKFERYQAEALIHKHLPVTALRGVICYNANQQGRVQQWAEEAKSSLQVLCKPGWYL